MPLFLGLDCGGSTTRAIVVDDEENIVFEGRGGPANVSSTPLDLIRNSLTDATRGIPKVDAIVGCFAGLLCDEGLQTALACLGEIAHGAHTGAFADYVAALAAASEVTDVVVLAGTGSLVCSWKDGKAFKSGGGGPLLGDEGSAFDVGRKALQHLCLNDLEAPASEDFWTQAASLFGTANRDGLVSAVYGSSHIAKSLALLAPVIGSDSELGFTYARHAVDKAISCLCHQVHRHCWSHVDDRPIIRVALCGGLWDASPHFKERMEWFVNFRNDSDKTDAISRQYHVERLETLPVLGAARLAKRLFYGN